MSIFCRSFSSCRILAIFCSECICAGTTLFFQTIVIYGGAVRCDMVRIRILDLRRLFVTKMAD